MIALKAPGDVTSFQAPGSGGHLTQEWTRLARVEESALGFWWNPLWDFGGRPPQEGGLLEYFTVT